MEIENRFKSYFDELEKISTRDLHRSAEKIVCAEKKKLALLIAHISEISRRKAHLELGYKNLFDYIVEHLGISAGSAYLRMQVANICRDYPEILECLSKNEISLTVAGLLCVYINKENCSKLLDGCKGKTKREVEKYLVELRPKPVFKTMIRKQPVKKSILSKEEVKQGGPQMSPGTVSPACPDVYNFRFSADEGFREKLMRLAEVLGIESTERNMQVVIEKALDLALDRKDPKKKLERRIKRQKSKERQESSPAEENTESSKKRSRYIPARIRERVLERASYRCEYIGSEGCRCTQRTGLEIDHREPFARGGGNSESNLRVLCKRHNGFQAERDFGEEFIKGKVKEGKKILLL